MLQAWSQRLLLKRRQHWEASHCFQGSSTSSEQSPPSHRQAGLLHSLSQYESPALTSHSSHGHRASAGGGGGGRGGARSHRRPPNPLGHWHWK